MHRCHTMLYVYCIYIFLVFRTSLFMKEKINFSMLNFWLPLGYVFALGLFFTEDTSQTRLLHRDMTDEWKSYNKLHRANFHTRFTNRTIVGISQCRKCLQKLTALKYFLSFKGSNLKWGSFLLCWKRPEWICWLEANRHLVAWQCLVALCDTF